MADSFISASSLPPLSKEARVSAEAFIDGEWRAKKVSSDGTSCVDGMVASRSKIIDEALLVEASRYLAPHYLPLISLGLRGLSTSAPFLMSDRTLGVFGEGWSNVVCGLEVLLWDVDCDPLRVILVGESASGNEFLEE